MAQREVQGVGAAVSGNDVAVEAQVGGDVWWTAISLRLPNRSDIQPPRMQASAAIPPARALSVAIWLSVRPISTCRVEARVVGHQRRRSTGSGRLAITVSLAKDAKSCSKKNEGRFRGPRRHPICPMAQMNSLIKFSSISWRPLGIVGSGWAMM